MDEMLETLSRKTSSLRKLNYIASMNFAFLLIFVVKNAISGVNNYSEEVTFLFLLLMSFSINFVLLFIRDQIRKDGESLYEEVSDELQWSVKEQVMRGESQELTRPSIQWRYILRDFVKNTSLPLGLTSWQYIFLNILVLAFGIGALLWHASQRYL